jgi:catechol 2,3-dioxygenase-like lactoylglutathione lyase family enzyme
MDWTLEVVVVPVGDVDRAIAFYRDQLGFNLDHDTRAGDQRFAQLTPPGSGCSIVLAAPPPMPPGSLKGLQSPASGRCPHVAPDAYRARDELVDRGVAAGDIDVIDERDGGTLFGFIDPDGNSWVVQQIKARADTPLLPRT